MKSYLVRRRDVDGPSQVVADPEVLHTLHCLAVDGDGVMDEGLQSPPEVQDHLLCFCRVEDQVVLLASYTMCIRLEY